MKRTCAIVVGVLLLSVGCRKKPPAVDEMVKANTSEQLAKDGELTPEEQAAVDELHENFKRVHFGLDSATLDQGSKDALEANAAILQRHTKLSVEIQGHADARGTVDYNLALGQRRARSVQRYLAAMGVSESRLPTMSFGEERPLVNGSGEAAWSANRRAEFRVVAGDNVVAGTVD